MAATVLFKSHHLAALAELRGTEEVVITFNEFGLRFNGEKFWGDGLLRKLNISAIGIVTTEPNWYPEDDMREALEKITPLISGKRVTTYGHSQGGYGALKYSRAVGAKTVLAFCPQWSINPADVSHFDKRYLRFFHPELRNGLKIQKEDVGGKIYIVFDKSVAPDSVHVEKLATLPGVIPINCPFSGHETVRVPAEGGTSAALISLLLQKDDSDNRRAIRQLLRKARENSSTYHKYLCSYLIRSGRITAARNVLPRLKAEAGIEAALLIAASERREADVEEIIKNMPPQMFLKIGPMQVWHLARSNNLVSAERIVAELIKAHCSGRPFVLLHAVNTSIMLGKHAQAKEELTEIVNTYGYRGGLEQIILFSRTLGLSEIESAATTKVSNRARARPRGLRRLEQEGVGRGR